jgi:hypothetical protein
MYMPALFVENISKVCNYILVTILQCSIGVLVACIPKTSPAVSILCNMFQLCLLDLMCNVN